MPILCCCLLLAAGAFDRNDLLFMRQEEDKRRFAEIEQEEQERLAVSWQGGQCSLQALVQGGRLASCSAWAATVVK